MIEQDGTPKQFLDDPALAQLREQLDQALSHASLRRKIGFIRWKHPLTVADRERLLQKLLPAAMAGMGAAPLSRTEILNFLIGACGYRTYLEIGVNDAQNFERITAPYKDGVDPAGKCNFPVTSDEFFAANSRNYDVIFIDGLHEARQVERDVENSLKVLNPKGMILLHDCNPRHEAMTRGEWVRDQEWCGTVWKAFANYRMTRPDLFMCTIHADYGVGVVMRGEQKLFPRVADEELNYPVLERNRKELLNLMRWDEFVKMIERRSSLQE